LPLGEKLNSDAEADDFKAKVRSYKQSKLMVVAEFVKRYGRLEHWGEQQINNRTAEIADVAFTQIWKL